MQLTHDNMIFNLHYCVRLFFFKAIEPKKKKKKQKAKLLTFR